MKMILGKLINSNLTEKIILFLRDNKKTVLSFMVAIIFTDIFFLKVASDLISYGVLFFYLFFVKIFFLKSRATFLFSLSFLIIMFFSYLFSGFSVPTEKAAVWLVLFLVVGIIQQWRE